MSYASCLNNSFAKQTIKDLTVSGTLAYSSLTNVLGSSAIPNDNVILDETLTTFYSKVLPAGNYFIRGVLGIFPQDGDTIKLSSYSIYDNFSTKYPIVGMGFTTGLEGSQYLPFNTCYVSDGIKPVEFSIFLVGGVYEIVTEFDQSIQYFAI